MSLEEKLGQDLKTAMRAKDNAAKRTIRAIKSEILKLKTDGTGNAIDEAKEVEVLQKMLKQRRDSLAIFEKQDREELAVTEREEIEVITKYLPEMLEGEALEAVIKTFIEKTGASSMRDMGKVMGMATGALKGKAEGRNISSAVKKLLTQ